MCNSLPASHLLRHSYRRCRRIFPAWKYSSDQQSIQRDGNVLYYFPDSTPRTVRYTRKTDTSPSGVLEPRALQILPTTPVGIVQYQLALEPGQKVTLDWKLPVVPVAVGSPAAAKVQSASFDEYLPRIVNFWNGILNAGLGIQVPEEKVNDTFKASLIYDLIARNKVGDNYIQTVNDFHYHAFWLRGSSFIVRMYDIFGYPTYARQALDFFAQWQQPDGNFVSQGGQFDGIGQVLWAYGQHYSITHDREFAEQVFPSVVKAVDWLQQARQSDPLQLMPATRPGDNERLTGNVTGHNFWALDGLRNTVILAKDLHLFSALSPKWIRTDSAIQVDRAPTNFDVVNFSLRSISPSRAELTFHATFVDPPQHIVLHLPWFMETQAVVADGKHLVIRNNAVQLPANVASVQIDWRKKADSEPLSYDRAVEQYKAEYAARYRKFLRTGQQ